MSEEAKSLTSGRILARNVVWNLTGLAIPMVVALFVIPWLIEGMGKERFGLLTIIWMGVGYFSVFDLGLGRALTKLIADRLGSGRTDELRFLIWSALVILLVLGSIGGLAVQLLGFPLVYYLLNVSPEYREEALIAFRILGVGVPIVVVSAALVGLLQAHQRFALIAAVRIPLGVLTFVGPLITSQFTPSIVWATGALLLSRILALVAYYAAALFVRTELGRPCAPKKALVSSLVRFGGWLTITNIIGPIMTYLDRFFVGAILNMAAVAYYVAPYEVISRTRMLPKSIAAVIFPAMATALYSDKRRLVILYEQSARVMLLIMMPITAGFFLLAPEALFYWLGKDFQDAATPVVQWLALGWMVNTLAQAPINVLQSVGRPDLVAKTHMTELIPYLVMLWFFTNEYGIAGTAAAWFLRVLLDSIFLNELVGIVMHELRGEVARTRLRIVYVLVGFSVGWLFELLSSRIVLLVLVAVTSLLVLLPVLRLALLGRRAKAEKTN